MLARLLLIITVGFLQVRPAYSSEHCTIALARALETYSTQRTYDPIQIHTDLYGTLKNLSPEIGIMTLEGYGIPRSEATKILNAYRKAYGHQPYTSSDYARLSPSKIPEPEVATTTAEPLSTPADSPTPPLAVTKVRAKKATADISFKSAIHGDKAAKEIAIQKSIEALLADRTSGDLNVAHVAALTTNSLRKSGILKSNEQVTERMAAAHIEEFIKANKGRLLKIEKEIDIAWDRRATHGDYKDLTEKDIFVKLYREGYDFNEIKSALNKAFGVFAGDRRYRSEAAIEKYFTKIKGELLKHAPERQQNLSARISVATSEGRAAKAFELLVADHAAGEELRWPKEITAPDDIMALAELAQSEGMQLNVLHHPNAETLVAVPEIKTNMQGEAALLLLAYQFEHPRKFYTENPEDIVGISRDFLYGKKNSIFASRNDMLAECLKSESDFELETNVTKLNIKLPLTPNLRVELRKRALPGVMVWQSLNERRLPKTKNDISQIFGVPAEVPLYGAKGLFENEQDLKDAISGT